MPNPATGSANPASSISTLWTYVQPALDHIMKSPTNDPTRAPSIDVSFYSGIHSACYNYFTAQSELASINAKNNPSTAEENDVLSGTDLYHRLDKYYAATARELLLGLPPDDDVTLIHYLVPCFKRYAVGAQSVNRLLSYVNRHYVKRAIDEDKGWLRLNDVLATVAEATSPDDSREKITQLLREYKVNELRRWGYDGNDGGGGVTLAQAEAYVEAGCAPDCVVPVLALGLRRFRIDCIEPLLAVPKKKKHKPKAPSSGGNAASSGAGGGGGSGNGDGSGSQAPPAPPSGPKSRLARAVKVLLEEEAEDEEERLNYARGIAHMLRDIGIRPDHPLRKKLDKFVAAHDASAKAST
ncbi:hypothetical protein FISHEDRAFT_63949 [Fistulina hepatica ATCC 64428]|uniref:Uncharacterized protein n=1 Tax=Fistulina hepatica ATCC 64428 TaxID=1128425 RepID=A0A0D7AKY8_9AGAR|nr:hypothetical protein FISHEDRAFT_63949 [Fistulina hepatica ATCC 64428]